MAPGARHRHSAVHCTVVFSTVWAAKSCFEGAKRELRRCTALAIGILIIQDLVTLAPSGIYSGQSSLLVGTSDPGPLAAPSDRSFYGFDGNCPARSNAGADGQRCWPLALGGMGFDGCGVSGEVGALVMGLLLANHIARTGNVPRRCGDSRKYCFDQFFPADRHVGMADTNALIFAGVMSCCYHSKPPPIFAWICLHGSRPAGALGFVTDLCEFGLDCGG